MSSIIQPTLVPAARQRWFWFGGAVLCALLVLVGFSPTFYLKAFFSTPELGTLKIVHGLVFSTWIVLFLMQTWLVAVDRRDLHRKLGLAGAPLLAAMGVIGFQLAIEAGRSGFTPDPAKVSALSFMAVPLFDLGIFMALVIAALLLRRRLDWHKRLMLIATLSLLPPALARVAFQFPPTPALPVAFGGTALIIVMAIVFDSVVQRRLHPAMLCSGLLVLASLPGRIAIAGTQTWQDFAAWLIS